MENVEVSMGLQQRRPGFTLETSSIQDLVAGGWSTRSSISSP
jgi:hypothetical protein